MRDEFDRGCFAAVQSACAPGIVSGVANQARCRRYNDVKPMPLRLLLLGPGGLVRDGRSVKLRSQKTLALVAYLAVEGATPRERLAGLLWESTSARANLRVELHHLAQVAPGLVQRNRKALALGRVEVDLWSFRAAVEEGRWAEAYDLYGGPFLDGLQGEFTPEFEDWLVHARQQLAEGKRRALETLARESAPERAVELWLERLGDDPLDEAACREAMEAYLRLEQPARALAVYHEHAAFLERELGLPPEAETRALAEFVRSGRRAQEAPGEPRFVGRELELAALEEAYRKNQRIFIAGEPGIGKTRLVREFARRKGLKLFQLRGRPGDAEVPHATLARALRYFLERGFEPEPWVRRELARILPELGEPPPGASPARLLAALARAFEDFDGPEWFWGIDDLQFVDSASLALVAGLAGMLGERPGAVTYRTGTLPPPAATWLQEQLLQGAAVEITLEPLTEEAVAQMLDLDPERARELARYTGGNPFFLSRAVGGPKPQGELRALVGGRLARAGSRARRVCELAAVAAGAYGPELAAWVLELSPLELAEAGDELERLGLFRRGRPAHDLVTEGALAALPEASRRYLHLAVAEALERWPGAAPAQVAHHFEQASRPERAVRHRLAAGRAAERGFAYREALEQYALAVAAASPEERQAVELAVLDDRFRLHLALLDSGGAERILERGQALARERGDAVLEQRVRLGWAALHFNRGDLASAQALANELLESGELEPGRPRAEALYIRAVARQARGDHEPALDDARAALEAYPDPGWIYHGWVHNSLAISLVARGDTDGAEAHNRTALTWFQEAGDLAGEANAERVFAEIAARRGKFVDAERRFAQALELARRAGHQGVLGYVLASALLFYEAREHAERVREIAREGARLAGPYRGFFEARLARG